MSDYSDFDRQWQERNDKLVLKSMKLSDYSEQRALHKAKKLVIPIESGIMTLNKAFNWRKGGLYLFTGYPQSGKSHILTQLALYQTWKFNRSVAVFTPEETSVLMLEEQIQRLTYLTGSKEKAEQIIEEKWHVIELIDGMPTSEMLMNEMEELHIKGVNMFVIDPMNWVTSSNYTGMMAESLRLTLTGFKQFAKKNDSVVAYVEHPKTPSANKEGKYPKAHVMMVHGGIMHWNKCDCCVVMHRLKDVEDDHVVSSDSDAVEFEVAKMKNQRIMGYPQTIKLKYNPDVLLYEPLNKMQELHQSDDQPF